jgi:predicted short-subunit dehydrogenase-like oxidoreductase (DUF2520 family)
MGRKKSVTVIGPGSLGCALTVSLKEAGLKVVEVVYRSGGNKAARLKAETIARGTGAQAVSFAEAKFAGDIVWICVADSAIAEVALKLAKRGDWRGKAVFHASGALSSDELKPLRKQGAKVASVHPMMTFVAGVAPSIKGVVFAVEGDAAALRMARAVIAQLGGESFVLAKKDKPLYHALGAFASPLVVAQMAAAEHIGRELGLTPQKTRRVIASILRQTVENYVKHGPAAAFSGPLVRGDVQTVRSNIMALKRVHGVAAIYRALSKVALEYLPVKNAKRIRQLLSK